MVRLVLTIISIFLICLGFIFLYNLDLVRFIVCLLVSAYLSNLRMTLYFRERVNALESRINELLQ